MGKELFGRTLKENFGGAHLEGLGNKFINKKYGVSSTYRVIVWCKEWWLAHHCKAYALRGVVEDSANPVYIVSVLL